MQPGENKQEPEESKKASVVYTTDALTLAINAKVEDTKKNQSDAQISAETASGEILTQNTEVYAANGTSSGEIVSTNGKGLIKLGFGLSGYKSVEKTVKNSAISSGLEGSAYDISGFSASAVGSFKEDSKHVWLRITNFSSTPVLSSDGKIYKYIDKTGTVDGAGTNHGALAIGYYGISDAMDTASRLVKSNQTDG